MPRRFRHRGHPRTRTGFTLLESMIAVSLLFITVTAVLTAITAGQQHAYDSHVRIAGTLAAEELMTRLSSLPYASLSSWNGVQQDVGAMTDANGDAFPATFDMIGRRVSVTPVTETLPNGVKVRGRRIYVQAFSHDTRLVAKLRQFIPEPKS